MIKKLRFLTLLPVLLASCGTLQTVEPHSAGNQAEGVRSVPELLTSAPIPAALNRAAALPTALGQLASLAVMGPENLSAQANNVITSLDVYTPRGVLTARLEIFGPRKVNLQQLVRFGNEYSYTLAGANDISDRVYLLGQGQYLNDRLNITLKAIGHSNFSHFVTANFADLVVITKKGEMYLLGEARPLNENQIAALREQYAQVEAAWRDTPQNFNENRQIWSALAGTSGQPSDTPLNQLTTQNYRDVTLPDGSLDLSAFVARSTGLSASSLSDQPAVLRALNGNTPAYDGYYVYNGILPGGGWAQDSSYWAPGGQLVSQTWQVMQWRPYPTLVPTTIIGCSASAAQALIYDMWRKGYNVERRDGMGWHVFSRDEIEVNEGYNNGVPIIRRYTSDALYTDEQSNGRLAAYNLKRSHLKTEYPTYDILNVTTPEGMNFSTHAMNASLEYGQVVNLTTDFARGLGRMLNRVWPWIGEQHVWAEWKIAGAGSSGTMREILKTQLPSGRAVVAMYAVSSFGGHSSIVKSTRQISYQSWMFWTGYDAYITTIDHPYEERLMTGRNIPASGIYTVPY